MKASKAAGSFRRPILALAFTLLAVSGILAEDGLTLAIGTGGNASITGSTMAPSTGDAGLCLSAGTGLGLAYGSYGEEFSDRGLSLSLEPSLRLVSGATEIVGSMSAANDGKYGAALADVPGGNTYGFYFLLDEGGIRQHLGPLAIEAGRLRLKDEVESPYSLFINSLGISTLTLGISYDDGTFFYRSNWLSLNHDSNGGSADFSQAWGAGYPERGATVKTYGLRLGEMSFGFQDSVVYAARWFDLEYLLSPLPNYFTQYVRGTGGVPWVTGYDDNEIMGAFWNWKRPGEFSAYVQLLLDDFGMGELIEGWNRNPWQMAASLGGRLETAAGSFGIYAAMATKYTFEPSNAGLDSDAYGYSYYPETRFSTYWQDAGTTVDSAIAVEDNEIGYKYGENNLAVQIDWRGSLGGFDLGGALEFRLAGSNSPANPGHDDSAVLSDGTKWLDEDVLEKRFILALGLARSFGPWRFSGVLSTGLALDALELRASTTTTSGTANDIWIYSPVSGNTKFIFALRLGVVYSLGWRY